MLIPRVKENDTPDYAVFGIIPFHSLRSLNFIDVQLTNVVGLERGPLSLVRSIEELLE